MRKVFQLLVLLFLLISTTSIAQISFLPGSIIEKAGVKVVGYINPYNTSVCEFKYDLISEVKRYSANEIEGFSITDGEYFRSKTIKFNETETKVFMKCLIEGTSSIYKYKDRLFVEKGSKFAELNNDEKIVKDKEGKEFVKRTSRYKGTLLYLFEDSPAIKQEIEFLEFNEVAIINLVRKYNLQLPDESAYKDYSEEESVSNIEIAPSVGYLYQTYKIDRSWSAMDLEQDQSALVGVAVNFKTPKINDKIRIQLNFIGFQKQLKGSYSKMEEAEYLYETECNATYLNARVGLKYMFTETKFKPYIGIGIDYFLALNSSGDLYTTRISFTDGSEIQISDEVDLLGSFIGIGANIGFEYSISEKSNLFLNIGYSSAKYSEFHDNIKNEYSVKTIYTNIGYYFSL